ncbi:hypothetical protein HNR08_002031 [Cellulomonas hominis]|uniref:Uncharacterized protein n=1 Tax=Cellulomonas hominis TaxID=156981 RepID=A0A7W8SFT2_9CELL|nr:hypothetical protein [Cellulomonas hominis]
MTTPTTPAPEDRLLQFLAVMGDLADGAAEADPR